MIEYVEEFTAEIEHCVLMELERARYVHIPSLVSGGEQRIAANGATRVRSEGGNDPVHLAGGHHVAWIVGIPEGGSGAKRSL